MKIMTMGCGERFSEETLGFASNSTIASGQSFKDGEMARIFNTLVYGWHALDPRELDLACPGGDGAGLRSWSASCSSSIRLGSPKIAVPSWKRKNGP